MPPKNSGTSNNNNIIINHLLSIIDNQNNIIKNQTDIINALNENKENNIILLNTIKCNDINKNMKSFAEATRSSITDVLNNNIVKTVNETINKQETNNINNMSIIMYNIKESSIEDYNSRKNEEMLYLNSIVSIISKDTPNLDNKIIDHYRLGKYDKNSSIIRPIKITFNNLQTKQFILNNAKNIKNSVYKHVNISMSLSKAEQIKLKELNTEAIHLSANNNDNIYKVRYLHNKYSIVKFSIKKR